MRRLLAAAAAGLLLVLGTGAQAGAAEPGWQVHNPPTTMDGWYTDQITAFGHDSAIALGTEYWIIGNHRTYKRVWQWGGQQWTTLTLPSESLVPGAVTGVSATDEWVFGRDDSGGATRFPGYRWNGGRWTEQGSKDFEVLAAQSKSASDLWAAGSDRGDGFFHPQVGHWNGSSWSVTRTPVPAGYSGSLTAVHAVSATNVWAAGSISADVANAKSEPYLVHWDGTSWTRAALPGFTEDVRLTSVLVRANGEVWAGGYQSKYVPGKAIVLRGTAQGFGLVPVPDTGDTRLTGFAEDGGTLYAGIGGSGDTTNGLLSWTGSGWQTATGPTAPTRRVGVLTAVPGGGLWAGGADKSGKQFLALR